MLQLVDSEMTFAGARARLTVFCHAVDERQSNLRRCGETSTVRRSLTPAKEQK